MQINAVETGAPGLSTLAFNAGTHNMTQHQVAQDANVAINGLPVVSSSNTVNTTIKGLTLNLLQAQPGKIVTVGVSQSTADIATAVTGFVTNFNSLVTTVNPLTKYDAATQTGGLLQSDSTLRNVMGRIRSELGSMVNGLNGSIKSLTDIGITTQADGTLVLDSTKLNAQLTSNPSGVAGVFAVQGTSSNTNVSFISSTTATNAGQYAINVTQVATQGLLNGASPSSLTVDSSNNNFAITVDGIQSGTVALTQKTYASYADLATEMQTRINGDSTIKSAGVSVGVTYDSVNNHMVLTSKSYGSSSQVAITANTTLLGLSVAAGTPGLDIAGTIGGMAATGNGRTLTSTAGNSIGLKLLIGDNVIGDKGTINFSRGIMERMDKVITGAIGTTGTFKNRNNGLQKNLAQIAADRIKLTDKMSKLQTSLLAKFNAMDALVGQMQSTASFLNQQFYKTTSTN
jgi:flagellar hook-associated protein 2